MNILSSNSKEEENKSNFQISLNIPKNISNLSDSKRQKKINNKSELKRNKDKNNSSKDNSKSNSISNLSLNLNIIRDKLDKKEKDINEIIQQKETLLNQIINENNESKDKRITYFENLNNLGGTGFENAGKQYIFQILNCLSVKRDFYFYHNIVITKEFLDGIFEKNDIEKMEIDFVISDVRIIDFINMLIYLFPNILDLNNLKRSPFKNGMNFEKLLDLRNKYKKSNKRIDIFGEIGLNIFNENEKIEQLKKYRKVCYNIKNKLKDEKKKEEILEKLKMKQNNKKLVLYITNGDYSSICQKNLNNEEIVLAQNKYEINSLIIYLKSKPNSKENNEIDSIILNKNLNNGQNKFIEQLIDLKRKKIKQSLINEKFKSVSYKLNNIEKRLRDSENEYSNFVKANKEQLMMNEFTSIFLKYESKINNYKSIPFDYLNQIKLKDNLNSDFEINIILLHSEKEILNKDIYSELKVEPPNSINVYDLTYNCSNSFHALDGIKDELSKKSKKKIYIIISLYTELDDYVFLYQLFPFIANYLSYLYIIEKTEISGNIKAFDKSHIIKYKNSLDAEKEIKIDIEKKFEEIKNNYIKYFTYSQKYYKILDEYNKLYKDIIITNQDNIINDQKKMKFKEIIKEHKALLIDKISQDISFILSFSTKHKNEIKQLIGKELESIIDLIEQSIIKRFIEQQTVTNELSFILDNFIKTLKENNNNNIYENLKEEEKDIKFKDEIISINGIQEIYMDDNVNNDNDDNTSNSNDDNDNGDYLLLTNKDGDGDGADDNKDDGQNKNSFANHTSNIDNENNFKINLLIEEIKNKLKYSITLINLKLYYKYFWTAISKFFINNVMKSISKKVLEEDK